MRLFLAKPGQPNTTRKELIWQEDASGAAALSVAACVDARHRSVASILLYEWQAGVPLSLVYSLARP